MKEGKQSLFCYRLAQIVSGAAAAFLFRRQIIRNEIKGKKGPFVVIANHEAALDFVNLIGITKTPMTFVISHSFYNSLPIKGFFKKLGVIPKQQFQTSVRDMKKMRAVIEAGKPLVIYPAGLMCEDGLSTPIPSATYKFLKWINADIYVARTYGTYFSMPKWADGIRAGKTYLDVYKLFSKEELEKMDIGEIKKKTNEAILFDAYREQEKYLVKYKRGDNIEGLHNVLYMCPHCKTKFSIRVKNRNTIYCAECGYELLSDEYAFLHNRKEIGPSIRYVSDWSRLIYEDLKAKIKAGKEHKLSAETRIHMIDNKKNKFLEVGKGHLSLSGEHFIIKGSIRGEEKEIKIPIINFASLPFSPGKHLEIQHGENIYRCVLNDGKLVMKFINMVKIFYELNLAARERIELS
ncbi:MAG: 1-acyl-sn-glycerol-3-phosphate acyltransferase [Oscillospiraceae bacterium]|nr:1-acyl-sn-glycerol-3-phosphate acyltransferase [Oscillospiraceae bacterium]